MGSAIIYAVEAFGATTSHLTEITRGIDDGDRIYYNSFITWEEDFGEVRELKVKKKKTRKARK